MILTKNQECTDSSLPHIHIFIVDNDSCDKTIDGAVKDSFFSKMVSVSSNGLICDDARSYIDFINGVCLSLCIISNSNMSSDHPEYPDSHDVLGDMSPYYLFITKNIQSDLLLVRGCTEMLCFMCLPDGGDYDTFH